MSIISGNNRLPKSTILTILMLVNTCFLNTGSLLAEEQKSAQEFIPVVSWRESDVTAWATVLCIHGLGLHKYVYEPFGKQMARAGVTTYAIDVHGFGSWKESPYGKVLDLKKSLIDIEEVVKAIKQSNPGRPVVLLGESMGGAVAIQAAARYPKIIDGVIACVPSGTRYKQKKDRMKTMFGFLRGPSKPMNMGPGIVKRATEDKKLQDQWVNDPKARLVLSPKELIAFQSFMNKTDKQAEKITSLPVLVIQGGQDRLVKAKGTADLFKHIQSENKDFVMLGKSEHLIFEEGQFDQQVVSVITSWLLKNVVASKSSLKRPNRKNSSGGSPHITIHDSVLKHNFDPGVQQLATGHFFLGQGFLRLKDKDNARSNFLEVLKLAPGSLLAQEADTLLSTALQKIDSTDTLEEKRINQVVPRFVSPQIAFGNDRPTMVSFYTKWLTKRDKIWRALQKLQLRYEGRLNMVRVDADDPKNRETIEHFHICAVPTFVFLDPENNFVDAKIGCTEENDIITGINEILSAQANKKPVTNSKND